jgi:RNA polymerase-binding protein DksA
MAAKTAAIKGKKVSAKSKTPPLKIKKKVAVPSAPSKTKAVKVAVKTVVARAPVVSKSPSKIEIRKNTLGSAPPGASKSAKVSSGLKKSELEHFRKLLLEKRREILGDVGSMENEAFKSGSNLSNMPIHMADVGTDNFEQEFTLGLIESERQILREIQEALGRVEDGTFGICMATNKPIGRMRLEAVPWAKYTIEYSRALEAGLVRRESDHPNEDDSSSGGDEDEE